MSLDVNTGYNADFNAFVNFASERMATDKKAVARFGVGAAEPLGGSRTIVAADSKDDKVGAFRRKGDQRNLNDAVRTLFKDSIIDMFGGENKIPESVKKAMLLGDYGQGKPLTVRRIMSVKNAIDADGTAKARAEREAVIANHKDAPANTSEAKLAKFGGPFVSSEERFAKGVELFDKMRIAMDGFPQKDRDRIAINLSKAGEGDTKMFDTMYRMVLENVERNHEADLDDGAELFTRANNSTIRLALLEYTGSGFKSVMSLPPEKREVLAHILDRFLEEFKGSIRQGERPVVQDDFVQRLVANINELDRLDKGGRLTAKALVKACYPDERNPGDFDLGNAIYADVKNMDFHLKFQAHLRTHSFYGLDDGEYRVGDVSYTEAMDSAADDVKDILGEEFVPKDTSLDNMVRPDEFIKNVEGLFNKAIAENSKVDVDDIGDAAYKHMHRLAVERRIGREIDQIALAKGLKDVSGANMAYMLLNRYPRLYDAFLEANNPAEAEAALAAIRRQMEEAVDRQIVLVNLERPTADKIVSLVAGRLGITSEEARGMLKFDIELKAKTNQIISAVQNGRLAGCREPGFDPAVVFDEIARNMANAYIAKYDEIDAIEGVSDEVKALWKADISAEKKPSEYDLSKIVSFASKIDVADLAEKLADDKATKDEKIAAIKRLCDRMKEIGFEVFNDWGDIGADERGAICLMALRPAMANTPALKPLLVKEFAQEDNVFKDAMPHLGESGAMVSPLKQLALEP